MTKSYDSIIGDVICGLHELREFVEEHEPSKIQQVKEIVEKLETLDHYMAYGEEEVETTIAGVDFSDSINGLKVIGSIRRTYSQADFDELVELEEQVLETQPKDENGWVDLI